MTANLERLADQLVKTLNAHGIPADRRNTETDTEGVNVWAPVAAVTDDDPNLNRYPQASVVLSDARGFHDYSWGGNFEHAKPIDTPTEEVAAAIIETLPANVREAAGR